MIRVYTHTARGQQWLQRHQGASPVFACVLGFTATGLIPGISAAGATSEARKFTAVADAEFLYYGPQQQPRYRLPPLHAGASPVFISRAVVAALSMPVYLFNAGLPQFPTVPTINLDGTPAGCISQGCAMEIATVKHLLEQGLAWGEKLAKGVAQDYLILGECVVGGTTTALAVLTGLGIAAAGKVNSSHPVCNHAQKWAVVQSGLRSAASRGVQLQEPLQLVAAVGDPMQIAVAGMAIAASRTTGVMLAGGTQMLAIYALMQALVSSYGLSWRPQQVVVGTTRWVAEDASGQTVSLAQLVGEVPLLATQLNFRTSRYAQLRAYEQGYVKEGMGAGGCAIAATLAQGWQHEQLLQAVEALLQRYSTLVDSLSE